MAKDKEVSKIQESTAVVAFDLESDLESYVATHDVRDIENDEIITPRINLLQSMSKQVKKSESEYIKGAEEGMMMNSLTKDVYDGGKGLTFIPCYNETGWNEWIPQSLGGGLVKRWGNDESFKTQGYVEEKGRWQKLATDDKGKSYVASEIIKYSDYYVMIVDKDSGKFSPAVIGFSGTKYKVHRKLINDISLADFTKKDGNVITPPPFYRVYDMFTIPESDGTNSWFNYKPVRIGNIHMFKNSSILWDSCKKFRELIQEGRVVASAEQQEEYKASPHDNEAAI